MTLKKHIGTFIFALAFLITTKSFAQRNNKLRCDSATISFKNVTKDSIKFIHAVIKGKEVAFYNLTTGQESIKFRVSVCGQNIYRFSIFKDNLEDKYSIEPMDYFDQVSNEEIKRGTYIYYIGYKDGLLDVQLMKQTK